MPDYQAYHESNYGCKEVVDSQVKLALEFKEKMLGALGVSFRYGQPLMRGVHV